MFLSGNSSQTLNVTAYGATGGGIVDDTNSINSCLAAAQSSGKSVYFPLGTYLCNINDASGHILTIDISGKSNITIYGDPGTTITTSDTNATNASGSTLLYIYSGLKDTGLIISNLAFVSTHGITQKQTTAIFLQGTLGFDHVNPQIYNCRFDGFGTPVGIQGAFQPTLKVDTFYFFHGHDCGQHGLANPVAAITFYDNGNGRDSLVDIERCVANGYTGPIPMNCPRPADNFIYGTASGYTVVQNQTKYLSQEHILISPANTYPINNSSILVINNFIDQSLPPGSVDDNGATHKYSYGMRIDASNTTITNNKFKNYSNGIFIYPFQYPTYQPNNLNIGYNTFIAPNAGDTLYQTLQSIAITGYTSKPYTGINIHDNNTAQVDTVSFSLINCTTPTLTNNKYSKVFIPQ